MTMMYVKAQPLPRVDDPTLNKALERIDEELNKIARVFIDWTADAGANNIHDDNIPSSGVTQHEADIDHDALTNFLATEHRAWEASIAQNIHDDNIPSSAVTQHEGDIDHDALTNFVEGEHLPALDEDDLTSNSDTNVATQQSIKAYVDSLIAGVNEFPELTDTPANYTGSAGKFVKVNATPDALEFASLVKADISDTPWAWADVLKTGSNLTDLATRQHAGLTNVTSDQHHAISHEARHRSVGADALNHDNLAGFVAGEHFLQSAITTVGTIGTGVWQGTAIANAYVAGIDQNLLQASSPTLNDLTISTPSNIYALSHNSFADYAANRHVVLPGTIANVLSNHNLANHNAFLQPPNSCWFRAYRTTSQAVGAGATDKVLYNGENYDIGTDYDHVTNHQFVAPANGYYFFIATIYTYLANGKQGALYLKKNGTSIAIGRVPCMGDTNYLTARVVTDVQLATGDIITVWWWNGDSAERDINSLDHRTFFCGRQFA